ncbi:MAG: hypothetical protein KGI02_10485, partial [Thaumarchaeota archaeon]|nr:hypothetical protein [Nitrososphaerota archaeon]MDE1840892.1 hypothetical protein [Nitrososphaerota archaeon]MDE1877463.1 hypothetical protein [Nitrososphaerota archaeon]
MTSKIQEFVWLELKPQQRFKDDQENQVLKIIQYATEFAFFVLRSKSEMRLIVRTTNMDQKIFGTIDGLTVERIDRPHFEQMTTRYLALKNHFMVPLVGLTKIVKSDVYSKLWQQSSGCMMACFVQDQTKKISNVIHNQVTSLESKMSKKNAVFSSKRKVDLAEAKSKLVGHNLYNCFIIFGVETTLHKFSELDAEKRNSVNQEKILFENHIANLKKDLTEEQFKKERKKQNNIHHDNVRKIKDAFKLEVERSRADIVRSAKTLDGIINVVLLNSFSHRITSRKIRFMHEKKTLRQKLAELFSAKSIDPYTFMPQKLHSKSLALSDIELAFFLSFPQEKDVQTINFGVGVTPTFVHSPAQDLSLTDLTMQCHPHQVSSKDQDRLNRSVYHSLKVHCEKCGIPINIKKDGKTEY